MGLYERGAAAGSSRRRLLPVLKPDGRTVYREIIVRWVIWAPPVDPTR